MTVELYEKKPGNGCVAELHFNGRISRQQLEFLVESVKKYRINKTTLNQQGSVIVWNLRREALAEFLAEAAGFGIVCGSAYVPERIRVLCAPLSGVEEGECFDVSPYADAARGWLAEHTPRVCPDGEEAWTAKMPFSVYFSNFSRLPEEGGACDLAFCAAEEGLFEIWAGNPAETGRTCGEDGAKKADSVGFAPFRLAERVEAGRFLSYIKAGLAIRGRAQNADGYRSLFWQTLAGLPDGERQPVAVETKEIRKTGNGNFTCGPRVVKQKQEELYAVRYHPLGGVVNVAFWQKLLRSLEKIEDVELRLDSRMNIYVCNLLAEEVGLSMDSMADGAFTAAEASPVQTFCGLCPRANCDAQMFAHVFLKETKKLGFADGVLPTFTVAGCKDACGEFQDVELRFLAETEEIPDTQAGGREKENNAEVVKAAGEKAAESGHLGKRLMFLVECRDDRGQWYSMGRIPQKKLTEYLIALGALPQSAGLSFQEWKKSNPGLLDRVTALYGEDEKECNHEGTEQ